MLSVLTKFYTHLVLFGFYVGFYTEMSNEKSPVLEHLLLLWNIEDTKFEYH